jgi:hypothetical protein
MYSLKIIQYNETLAEKDTRFVRSDISDPSKGGSIVHPWRLSLVCQFPREYRKFTFQYIVDGRYRCQFHFYVSNSPASVVIHVLRSTTKSLTPMDFPYSIRRCGWSVTDQFPSTQFHIYRIYVLHDQSCQVQHTENGNSSLTPSVPDGVLSCDRRTPGKEDSRVLFRYYDDIFIRSIQNEIAREISLSKFKYWVGECDVPYQYVLIDDVLPEWKS